ncbi:MAG: ATP-dependent Clp protease ATP-binding subunit ClpA [Bdellovibrionales bacterium]|nr:ATP-dependent Clp protease ATP-binding subunit ClpA [Bdellovibrionales bacterium]
MMSKELERKLSEATELAKKNKHEFVTLEHILYALCGSAKAVDIIQACGGDGPKLKQTLKEYMKQHCPIISEEQLESYGGFESWSPEFTLACHRLIQRSAMQIKNAGKSKINEGTLLVSLFYEQESFAVFALSQQGVSQFDIINYISHGVSKDGTEADASENIKTDIDGQPADESKANVLDQFCVNLNEKATAGKIDPLIGREEILERITQVLMRRTKNNPLLIGEPGVGKTAIIEGLAKKITEGQVPAALKEKLIYSLDMGSLLAGTKFRGDFENRIKTILKEVKKNPNIILFIDEIHTLVGAGATSGGSMDASNLLKPALANGEISCIGSTTHTEFRQHFEKDRALNRRFQKLDVQEPSPADTLSILRGIAPQFENFHNVKYSEAALQSAVDLSVKHINNKLLPDKAIDVIDECGSFMRLKNPEKKSIKIEPEHIEEVIAKMTGLPIAQVSSNEKAQLKDLDRKLKALIFGQDEAIDKLVASIKLSRSGLARQNKPIGSYLFAGPTGVGKTEVCKQLANLMGVPFVRFDMSEYMEKHSVARLVGAPPGYVGYEDGGLLTEAVTKQPYSVILMDEIEKAHSDITYALLQVMDAGRLTDSQGRVADFKNSILILTTNAGAYEISKGTIGIVDDNRTQISQEAIKKAFAPEFINRLDSVVHFKDLSEDIIFKVANKFVDELKMTLAEKKVELIVSQDSLKWLMKKGYDKAYGARPMARAVDEFLKKPLVDELLFGRLVDGGKIIVELEASALKFHFSTSSGALLTHKSKPETVR